VEDLRGPSPEELAMVQDYSACDESERPLTPYARVTSRALQEVGQAEAHKKSSALRVARRGLRLATVPVIFCAYFFYAQLLFQHDAVQAATIQPLIAMGFGQWAHLNIPGG
jgi:hypothetical protein